MLRPFSSLVALLYLVSIATADDKAAVKILFLGDKGHHQPAERFKQLQPVMARRGIGLTYTERADDLNPETLAKYDGLAIYANIDAISAAQEAALLQYVENGRGLIPIHCATYCFRNSKKYVDLVGAQFQRHGTGTFRTTITQPDHPIMKGFKGFESWDETYVHTLHNTKDRTVLETRKEPGQKDEPWTWVRTQGKGRVFYTAWGHDERTWGNPGFQNLIERGIRWAVGADLSGVPVFADRPEMTTIAKDLKPFEYVDAKVPFYPAGKQWGTQGEELSKMQKPLSPEESMKHFVTPVGFKVELFASEPDLKGKPIAMAWDERGRCWVCETVDYPNELQPEGQGRDRIRICEDTDGDGKADRFTVFAEKLSIPTSLAFTRGGVVITQAPHTLFLKDTNGDDVADEQKVLFTGWGTGDTHAGPSNLQYGFDNWIYGSVGYSGFEGTVGGEKLSFKQGFFRFLPDGSKLEFLRSTDNNTWGIGFSEEGLLFGSTANRNPSVFMPIPNRYYEQVRGWSPSVLPSIAEDSHFEPITEKVRQMDHHGNFTAAAGHALYTARTYPPEYWNRTAFVCEPTGHLVSTFVIEPRGASFHSKYGWNLLASDDEWSSPVMAEVGPDGNVWVIDWYNYIVQHNPTPQGYKTGKGNAYETPLRDKTHGRIYRVVPTGAKPAKGITLKDAAPEKLVATLKSDNLLWRKHAQRLLVERGEKDVSPALEALVADSEHPLAAVHSLWALAGLNEVRKDAPRDEEFPFRSTVTTPALDAALKSPSAAVRRTAVSLLPRTSSLVKLVQKNAGVSDPDIQVRLAALLAFSEAASDLTYCRQFIELEDQLGSALRDPWLRDGMTTVFARHASALLPAAVDATRVTDTPEFRGIVQRAAEHYARSGPKDEDVLQFVSVLVAALDDQDGKLAGPVIAGLATGWPKNRRVAFNAVGETALKTLFSKAPGEAKGQLIALASRMGTKALDEYSEEIVKSLLAEIEKPGGAEAVKIAAAAQLIEFQKESLEAAAQLLDLITPRTAPAVSRGLLEAVGKSEAVEVGPALIERLRTLSPGLKPIVYRSLLARAEWTQALLDALEKGDVQPSDMALDQRQALSAHPDRKIAERAKTLLTKIGALPSADRQKVYEQLLPVTQKTGDPKLGKEMYKKHCSKCHVHGEEGTRIGPDLTGMSVHPKAELLTNILDPSRSVEGNFRQYAVATISGNVINGMLLSESKTALELVDVEGKKHTVLREDIDELAASTKSLMPEGFEKQMNPEELTNLLEFLAQRGRYLPVPLNRVANSVSTRGMFVLETADVERLIFPDWKPKTVEGVPFLLIDPQGDRVPNAVLFYGPQGKFPPTMPKTVTVPCNAPARAIYLLSGVSGWGFPIGEKGSVSLIVRLHYADGSTEDHPLKNGEHFADYIRRVDVPGSKFAFQLRGQQIRFLSVSPKKAEVIKDIEFVKGPDTTAPVIMAVTVDTGAK